MDEYFASDSDPGEGSKNEFKRIVMPHLRVFLYAGHDTTSSTLLYCYYMLSRERNVLSKLREEHDAVFGTDFSIENVRQVITDSPQLLNKLPYTLAFIKEVLRFFPPAGSIRQGRRDMVLTDEEGNRYPTEGCGIWTLTLILHHNPKVFVKAEQFLPQRWLVGPEDPLYPTKGSWRPFEFGPRNCIGQTLALLELRIALVMTARMFDITPVYNEWDMLHPTKDVKTIEGHRMYQVEMGGGGAHPADAFPCRVTLRS
jgi:cytochrome P450